MRVTTPLRTLSSAVRPNGDLTFAMLLLLAPACAREERAIPEAMDNGPNVQDPDGAVATADGSAEGIADAGVGGTDEDGNGSTDENDAGNELTDATTGSSEQEAGPAPAGQGTCDSATPHGCYVPQPGNHPMCPERSPEQSASYPPTDEWDGCNGIEPAQPFGLDPEATCAYQGPAGQIATCVCDTGLHWLCSCGAGAVGGIGQWPCTP